MTTIAELSVVIGANISKLTTGLNDADKQVKGFGTKVGDSLKNVGGNIAGVGTSMTLLTAPITAFGIAGVQAASDFEGAMVEISARTGLVGDDLQMIEDYALRMGAETAFSAQQAADALLQLTTSGQSVEQAMQTLPAVMNLAAASGSDLGVAADAVTDIMAQFGLEASAAADIADTLAQAAGASSADIDDLTEAFGNVGPIASQFGLDVEDTSAVLAIFAENGVKGAEAGTQLKSMLLNFTSETAQSAFDELGVSLYDAEGNMRDFETVIGELDVALEGMPVEDQNRLMKDLAGSYGITGLSALLGGISIGTMKTAMDGAADAGEVAQAKMDTFAGSMDALKGSVETLQITALTPLMNNILKPMADKITEVVNQVTAWTAENPEAAASIMGIVGAVIVAGPVLIGLGAAISAIGTISAVALSPVGLLVIAIAGFALLTDWEAVKTGLNDMSAGIEKINSGSLDDTAQGIREIGAGIGEVVAAVPPGQWADGIIQGLEDIGGTELPSVTEGLAAWGDAFANAWYILEVVVDRIQRGLSRFVNEVQLEVVEFIAGFRQTIMDATGGQIDIAPSIVVAQEALQNIEFDFQVADGIEALLREQMAGGEAIDLGEGFTNEITFNAASIADRMSVTGVDAVTDALTAAFMGGDLTGIQQLMPLALELDLNDVDLRAQVEQGLITALYMGDQEMFDIFTPLALDLGIDVAKVKADVQAQIEGQDYSTSVNATVTVHPLIQLAADVFAGIQNAIAGAVGAAGAAIDSLGASVAPPGGIPIQDVGTPMVRSDGLAYLHQGEAVLTKEQNRALRSLGGGATEGGQRSTGNAAGGNTYIFNISSFGTSPRELLELVKSEAAAQGL